MVEKILILRGKLYFNVLDMPIKKHENQPLGHFSGLYAGRQ